MKQASADDQKTSFSFDKSKNSEFIYIGSFSLSGGIRIWGPKSVGPDDIGSDHMYVSTRIASSYFKTLDANLGTHKS